MICDTNDLQAVSKHGFVLNVMEVENEVVLSVELSVEAPPPRLGACH